MPPGAELRRESEEASTKLGCAEVLWVPSTEWGLVCKGVMAWGFWAPSGRTVFLRGMLEQGPVAHSFCSYHHQPVR